MPGNNFFVAFDLEDGLVVMKHELLKPKRACGEITALDWEPRIVAFLCNWCSYAGADLAGVSRFQYPASIRIIRVPCSGRVSPNMILDALKAGADGVLVSGCHPGDCHYISGNLYARRRFALLKNFLEFIGIEPGRVNFSWVSASEGGQFADVVKEVTARVKALGPQKRLTKGIRG
jgi:coenzyme F420-reducing hydrogenase delta subunit